MGVYGTTKKPSMGSCAKHQKGTSSDFKMSIKPGTVRQGNGGPAHFPRNIHKPKKF